MSRGAGDEPRTDARSAARGTLALLSGQAISRLLAFGFVAFAARELAPAEFGRYATATAVLIVAASLADFGTTTAVARTVSAAPDQVRLVLPGALRLSLLLGAVAATGMSAFAVLAYTPTVTVDLLIAAAALPFDNAATSCFAALDGLGRITVRAALSLLRTTVVAIGGVVALAAGMGVRGALVAVVAAAFLSLLAGGAAIGRAVRPQTGHSPAIRGRDLLSVALPFALLGLVNVLILRFDLVLLSVLRGTAEAAKYEVALRAVETLLFGTTVLASPALFLLTRRLARGERTAAQRFYDQLIRTVHIVGLGVTAMGVGGSQFLVLVVAGSKYAASVPLLRILSAQLWLASLAAIQGSALLAGGRAERAVPVYLAVGAFAIAIDGFAVTLAGATGAAVAMIAIQGLVVAVSVVYLRRVHGLSTRRPTAAIVLAAAAATCSGLIVESRAILSTPVVVPFVYAGVLAITGGVTIQDVRRVIAVIR